MAKQPTKHKTFQKRGKEAPVKASAFGNGGYKAGYDEGGEVEPGYARGSRGSQLSPPAPTGGIAEDNPSQSYQRGGEVRQRPTHAVHNDTHKRMIANTARRDPYHAVRLLQGLRREHKGLRTLGAVALAHSHGLRAVGRHELAHGHDAHALHLLNHAHAKVPDGAEVNFTQHDDHHFNANVKRNGRETNFPLNRHQLLQWAVGPAGEFDHSIENGAEKNLGILTRPRRGPVRGYQEGGEVTDDGREWDPATQSYFAPGTPPAVQDPDAQAVRATLEEARRLHFPQNVADYVSGTGDHSAPPETLDTHRNAESDAAINEPYYGRPVPRRQAAPPSQVPERIPGQSLEEQSSAIKRAWESLQAPRPVSGAPAPREYTPEEKEAQRAEQAERERVTATPLQTPTGQVPEILRPGAGGVRAGFAPMPAGGYGEIPTADVIKPGGRFAEYGETKLTPEERLSAARSKYLEEQQPKWEQDAAWLDREIEDQIRKGLINPGDMPRNLAQERKAQRWPMGGGSESRGLYPDTVTKDMRDYTAADRTAGAYDQRLVNAMNAKRALAGYPSEIPSVGGVGTFKAPLAREPQARDVVPSDVLGRSRAQQVQERVRPPTQFEPGYVDGITPRPEEYAPRAREWMQQPTPPYARPAWRPAPNIRGAVGMPPPAGDMSPEAQAARMYPSAAQQPQRRVYQQELGERQAAEQLKREELASKEHIADTAAKAKVDSADVMAAAKMKAADAKQIQQMTDRQFADAYERHIRTYQSLRKNAATDEEKAQIDTDFKPPSGWKERYDAIMGGTAARPTPSAGAESGTPLIERQQEAAPPPPGPARAGHQWFYNKTSKQWIQVPLPTP